MLARAGPATSVPLGPYFSPQRFNRLSMVRWSVAEQGSEEVLVNPVARIALVLNLGRCFSIL